MNKSYNKDYLKIYFWKFLRIISGILSMTVVIPLISYNTQTYGLYVLCISIISFLQYSDFGFLSAGQKYASEYYAQNDKENEIKILSFVHLIMLIFLILGSVVIIFFSIYPETILSDINENSKSVASKLFLILAVTSPFLLFQKYAQSIYSIRIQDYKYQKIELIINVAKILGVYFFYDKSTVNIIGYFLFSQLLNILIIVISFIEIKILYKYNFKLMFLSFRFDIEIYHVTKRLAISSLISTISWILFFQIDSFIVARIFGVNSVAIYAIPYFLLTFINSLYNTIYYPFLFRFNHLINDKDKTKLYDFLYKIFELSLPLFIIPISIIIILMKPLILSWVGVNYTQSIIVAQILMTSLFWIFITMPYSYLLLSKEKIRLLNFNSIILPVVFFLSFLILKGYFSLMSIAIAKSVALFLSAIFYSFKGEIQGFSPLNFILRRFLNIFLALVSILVIYYFFSSFLNSINSKNMISVFRVISIGGIMAIISSVCYLLTNKKLALLLKNIIKSL